MKKPIKVNGFHIIAYNKDKLVLLTNIVKPAVDNRLLTDTRQNNNKKSRKEDINLLTF